MLDFRHHRHAAGEDGAGGGAPPPPSAPVALVYYTADVPPRLKAEFAFGVETKASLMRGHCGDTVESSKEDIKLKEGVCP